MGKKGLVSLAIAAVLAIGVVGALVFIGGEDSEPEDTANDSDHNNEENDDSDDVPAANPVTETVADGFDGAWGLSFLPDSDQLLVTESSGTLSIVDTESGDVQEIDGVPDVDSDGQGGLMDVTVDPDFENSELLYLTYSATAENGNASTHLASAHLDLDALELDDVDELFVASPVQEEPAHFGSRVEVGSDGHLFLTIGDRGDKNFDDHISQDTSNTLGTTLRLEADGSIPDDNPFLDDDDFADEIYSYGHRNVQGMAFQPETGDLWQGEHGEEDGDAIHVIEEGGHYGWPVAHTGCEYGTDIPVGVHPSERDDVVDPIHYWECGSGGFPPAGMTFYEGEQFPAWEGDMLIGGLDAEYLARFTVDGHDIEEDEPLLEDEGWRVRDVVIGPHDGAIYVAIDDSDSPLVRIVDEEFSAE